MKRFILISLVPVIAQAAITYTAQDGNWTNGATWIDGVPPTNTTSEAWITNALTVTSAFSVSNVTIAAGSLVVTTSSQPVWRGKFLVSGGSYNLNGSKFYYTGGIIAGLSNIFDVTGGVVSNGVIDIRSNSGSFDWSDLYAKTNLQKVNFSSSALTNIVQNVTNTTISFSFPANVSGAGRYVLIRDVSGAGTLTVGNVAGTITVISNVTWSSYGQGLIQGTFSGTMTINNSTLSCGAAGSSGFYFPSLSAAYFTNVTLVISNGQDNGFQLPASCFMSNVNVTALHTTSAVTFPLKYGGKLTSLIISGYCAPTLSSAIEAETLSLLGSNSQLKPVGYQVSANYLSNAGTITASNSVFVVGNTFINSGVFSQMTSTVQLGLDASQSVLSNVPTVYNVASSYAGKSISIKSNLTVFGTASFNTSASSSPGIISGAPCLLTLSNAGTAFGYGLSNIGVAARGRMLNTWGAQGAIHKSATGNINQVGRFIGAGVWE